MGKEEKYIPTEKSKSLKKHLRMIVNDLIKKSARAEALDILEKSDKLIVGEFLYYYYSGKGNISCLVLDKGKDFLVKNKIMKRKKNDSFGGFGQLIQLMSHPKTKNQK